MKPTIGRIVHFWSENADRQLQEIAAIIVSVKDNNTVDLVLFWPTSPSPSLALRVPFSSVSNAGCWTWPAREEPEKPMSAIEEAVQNAQKAKEGFELPTLAMLSGALPPKKPLEIAAKRIQSIAVSALGDIQTPHLEELLSQVEGYCLGALLGAVAHRLAQADASVQKIDETIDEINSLVNATLRALR